MSGKAIGWIKTHRKLRNWEWYNDLPVRVVFQHLLLSVEHEDSTFKGCQVKAGERAFSTAKLAEECCLSVQQTKTALSKLKSTNEVTIRATNKFSIISITRWSEYQVSNQQSNQQSTCVATSRATTSKEDNNIPPYSPPEGDGGKPPKKSSSKDSAFPKPAGVEDIVWHDFLQVRKQKRAPMTQTAMDGIVREAEKAGYDLNEALRTCCERGWQGFKADWLSNDRPGAKVYKLSDRSISPLKRFGPI